MTVESRAEATDDFVCLDGTGHPVAEDVGGNNGWKELKAAYRTQRPNKEQREKREWFEKFALNGDARGLGGELASEWDIAKVNRDLGDLRAKIDRMAEEGPSREELLEHIMARSREDINRLWRD